MIRRTFLNAIGGAIIGTAIALRLPDVIAPLNHLCERPKITYKAMMDAYNLALETCGEPHTMLVGTPAFVDYDDLFTEKARQPDQGVWLRRHQNAIVVDDPKIPDDVIQVHTLSGKVKEFYFS